MRTLNASGFIALTVILLLIGMAIGILTFQPNGKEHRKKKEYRFDKPAEIQDRKIDQEVLNTKIQESVDGSSANKEFNKE